MFKRTLLKLLGMYPRPSMERRLQDAGYIVFERHDVWSWHHSVTGARGGQYSTARAATLAAWLDYIEKQELQK